MCNRVGGRVHGRVWGMVCSRGSTQGLHMKTFALLHPACLHVVWCHSQTQGFRGALLRRK